VNLWNDELEQSREQIRLEAVEFADQFPDSDPGTGTPKERAQLMRRAEAAMVLRSDKATDRFIEGPAGALLLREFRPARPRAAMIHIHGGGWMTGEPALTDLLHQALCEHLDLAIVSVDYRLSPEHPYPAGPDDCEAAALWLIENSTTEYGTDRLLIGGESAGAHLCAVTLLRLRDRHNLAERIVGANLVFGAYDLSGTPSARGAGTEGTDILAPERIAFMADQFLQGLTPAQRRDPDVSPLYADLRGLPRALFTVGTADHLVDDTLFMASRWALAGNAAELLVYPDAPHGCIGLPTVLGHWWTRLEAFLDECMGST
jgi:acetyl esterase/lipase